MQEERQEQSKQQGGHMIVQHNKNIIVQYLWMKIVSGLDMVHKIEIEIVEISICTMSRPDTYALPDM